MSGGDETFDEASDDMLMALADGELSGEVAGRLRSRIAQDPDLAARFAIFVETRALTASAFDAGPVPASLVGTILAADPAPANVVSFPARRRMPLPAWGMGIAAALVLAAGLGGLTVGRSLAPEQVALDPAVGAAEALAQVATGGEASLPGGGAARVLGSYETDAGLCRLIELELPAGAERAVACRAEAGWTIAVAVATNAAEAFVPASENSVALIEGVLDDLAAGPPLDPQAEAAALAN